MTEAVALRDRDMTFEHDEHAEATLAGLEQILAGLEGARRSETAQTLDLRRAQGRKNLLVTWVQRCRIDGRIDRFGRCRFDRHDTSQPDESGSSPDAHR